MLVYPADGLDRLFLPVNLFQPYTGSPVMGASSGSLRVPYMLFDAAATEGAYAVVPTIPSNWNTVNTYIWTVASAAVAANNVVFSSTVGVRTDGSLSSASHSFIHGGNSVVCAISGTQYTSQRHTLGLGTVHNKAIGDLWQAIIVRNGPDGSDNYAGDIGVIGLELVRAS